MKNGVIALAMVCTAAVSAANQPTDDRVAPGITLTDDVKARLDAFFAMAEGEYRGSWPGVFAQKPELEAVPAWAVWKRLDLPAFRSSYVLFHEVREDGPTGRILRQRIVVFDDAPDRTHNYSTFYVIEREDNDKYGRADLHPEKLARLTPVSLRNFGRGCQVNMVGKDRGFLLTTSTTSCVFPYRSDGKSRYNELTLNFQPGGFSFLENAHDIDGNFMAGGRVANLFLKDR